MDNKIFVFDLDGTLLNSQKKISKTNLKVIQKLKDRGHFVTIATGRPSYMIKAEIAKIKPNLPVISTNGALITDFKNYNNSFSLPINSGIASRILNFLFHNNYDFLIYTKNSMYYANSSQKNPRILQIKKQLAILDSKYRWPFFDLKLSKIDFRTEKILKFLVLTHHSSNAQVKFLKSRIDQFESIYLVKSQKNFLDIMTKNASKGEALVQILNQKKLKINNTIAFGDSHNDLDLFAYAKTSIAMANAEIEVKNAANFVTKEDNNHNGVAKFISKEFLNESS